MPRIRTQAIVLDAREYRETSLLVNMLTPEYGRIGVVARGARRPKSTLAAVLQPATTVSVELSMRETGGLATLTDADLVHRPDFLRRRDENALAAVAYAGLYAEVLLHTHENDPHSADLYARADVFFSSLGEAEQAGSCALRGLFGLAEELGFGMTLPRDVAPDSDTVWLIDLVEGRLEPGGDDPVETDRYFPITGEATCALAETLHAVHTDQPAPVLNRRVGRPLMRLVIRLIETQIESHLRSARYIETMVLS